MKPEKPPVLPPRPPVNPSIFSEEEKKAALDRVRKKLADEWAMRELGGTVDTGPTKGPPPGLVEDQYTITLDLYEGSPYIVLDGKAYWHGGTYTVGQSTYSMLREIAARGWGHQREIEGKSENTYRKEQHVVLSANDAKQ